MQSPADPFCRTRQAFSVRAWRHSGRVRLPDYPQHLHAVYAPADTGVPGPSYPTAPAIPLHFRARGFFQPGLFTSAGRSAALAGCAAELRVRVLVSLSAQPLRLAWCIQLTPTGTGGASGRLQIPANGARRSARNSGG